MYGFWLPNDPRGSGSDYIASWEPFRYGPEALRFPPVLLTGQQALTAAEGLAWAADEGSYWIHACAVLPDHVRLVIGRHSRQVRKIVGHGKARATRLLHLRDAWAANRPVWGEHGWNVFLSTGNEVDHAIAYVNDNPIKEGKPLQRWSFVKAFNASVALAAAQNERVAPSAVQAHAAK
jgi:hypothetical protein